MTAAMTEPRTRRTYDPAYPVHHLDLNSVYALVKAFRASPVATTEEARAMRTPGVERANIRARFDGLSSYVRRLLARRRFMVGSEEWDAVVASIKDQEMVKVLVEFPADPDADYFMALDRALGTAWTIRRDIVVTDLADRRIALVIRDDWPLLQDLLSVKHVKVLERVPSARPRQPEIDTLREAVEAAEKAARRQRNPRPADSAGRGVAGSSRTAQRQAEQLRRKHDRSSAAYAPGTKGGKNQQGSKK